MLTKGFTPLFTEGAFYSFCKRSFNMAWIGSITDREAARRSAGAILMGQGVLGVTAGNLSSYTAAQVAAGVAGATLSVCDQGWSTRQIQRAYHVASNLGGTFDGSYTDLYNSLPDSAGHYRSMLQG
jgi:hypothetical protein